MFEVSYEHDLPEPGSRRRGLTQTLREMRKGGSVDIPQSKKASVYSAARAAGVKVRIKSLDKGLVRIWRADGPERSHNSHYPADGLDIFGRPVVKTAPTAASLGSTVLSNPITSQPAGTKEIKVKGGHFVEEPYGSSTFVPDDPVDAKNSILS